MKITLKKYAGLRGPQRHVNVVKKIRQAGEHCMENRMGHDCGEDDHVSH